MLRHALKLVWNRRRANRLVIVEVAVAFVVTFVVVALAFGTRAAHRRPLGFEHENVWGVTLDMNETDGPFRAIRPLAASETRGTVEDVLAALRSLDRVEAAHGILMPPFTNRGFFQPLGRDAATTVTTMTNAVSAEGLETLGVRAVDGRLFGPQDLGAAYVAVIVNRAFVEQTFGPDASPLGKRVNYVPPEMLARMPPALARSAARELRVVGVIDDFRQFGEYSSRAPYAITQLQPDEGLNELFVKVAPGTGRDFEERIVAAVEAIAPGWTATVTTWEERRADQELEALLPVKVGAALAAFVLAMVALGLIGIVWQDVVWRTQEIGVRRAAGANAARVRGQIVLESLVIGLFGIAIGAVLAVQLPLFEIGQIDWSATVPGLVLAAVVICALTAGAALYPAWLASRSEPADALRYE